MINIQLVHTDTLSCETIFRLAPNGDYLMFSQCGGGKEPSPDNRTFLFRSTDGGKTWLSPVDIFPTEKRAVYCTEVFVNGKEIRAYILVHNGFFREYDKFIAKSWDCGYTWTYDRDRCFEDFGFIRSGLCLSDGRYMTVAQHYPGTEKAAAGEAGATKEYIWKCEAPYAVNTVVYEDGKRGVGGSVLIPREYDGKRCWKWSEPTVVELENGHLVMLLRFQGTDYLWRSDSFDYGETWTEARKTDIENPGNKPKLIKAEERVILLNTFHKGNRFIDRSPLGVWISDDGMQTWGKKITTVVFPAWLSYPDGIFDERDGKVKFGFELNRHDIYFVEVNLRTELFGKRKR